MEWRWWRRKPKQPPDVPRRNWARLSALDTTIDDASALMTHTDLFEAGEPRPAPPPDAGPTGRAGGIVRPHPMSQPEPDLPDGTVGGLPDLVRTMPVVRTPTDMPVPLTRASAATVGTPQQPATPFHNITDFDRLMAQYENLDNDGLAAAIGMSSVADPPTATVEPASVERGRSLRRATLAQSRRMGLTARNRAATTAVEEPESPQETDDGASRPTSAARAPGEPVYQSVPWTVATQEWTLPGFADPSSDVLPASGDPPLADAELRRELQDLRRTVHALTGRREPPDLTDPETVSDLAGRLYRHIRTRLRAELLIDRERHGTLADHW